MKVHAANIIIQLPLSFVINQLRLFEIIISETVSSIFNWHSEITQINFKISNSKASCFFEILPEGSLAD